MPQRRSGRRIRVPARLRRRTLTRRAASLALLTLSVGGLSVGQAAATTTPPPVTILTPGSAQGNGDIFIAPTGDQSSYGNGPEILSRSGGVRWFHAVPTGQSAADFRTQTYRGKPVLTFWQGTGLGGLSSGADHIYNDHYQPIATVTAGNGLTTDGHEFLITPQNTALVLSYVQTTADLTSIGGPADQSVIDGVVQEVNIRTGRVLFQWNSADHVPYSQSEQPLPNSASTPWDWFHVNAVHLGPHGSLLVDARNTWTTYDVNRHSGAINWQLGGKASSFSLAAAPGQSLDNAGEIFAWQHDPEYLGHGIYTFFDNESAGTPEFSTSRTVTVRLDYKHRTATLLSSNDQPEGLVAPSQGNAQTLSSEDQFVGWGALPYISEFSRSGRLLFNAEFPTGVNTYRAYLLPWSAHAAARNSRHRHRGEASGRRHRA